ncbi:hypothetical protein GR927_46550 [Mycolicibacterium sp. 3033]|nr:hypothetical protein [Mycolicibacterium aurantiacum]
MPRQNPVRAREAQRREGMGPIYRRLLDRERDMQRRFGVVGQMRRPRYLLDALEAGETVTVPIWRVPMHLRPPRCGETLVVTPDM